MEDWEKMEAMEERLEHMEQWLDRIPVLQRIYCYVIVKKLGLTTPQAIFSFLNVLGISSVVLAAACACLLLMGCRPDREKTVEVDAVTHHELDYSHEEILHQVNLDILHCNETNCDSMVAAVDSLQHDGWLPQPLADYGKGMLYERVNRYRLSEHFLRRALDNIELRQWPTAYFSTVVSTCNQLIYKKDYRGALTVCKDPYEWMMRDQGRQIDDGTFDKYYSELLNIIGNCQLMLGRRAEGAATMEQGLEFVKSRALADTTDVDRMCAWMNFAVNVAMAYSDTDDNNERWVHEAEEAVRHLIYHKKAAPQMVDEAIGRTASLYAIWLAQQGRQDEAGEVFRRHRETKYSETSGAREEQLDYYRAAGQYDKAVGLLEEVCNRYREAGTAPSLDYLAVLGGAIEVYHRTGHDDDVVKTALEMAALADSVRRHEREDDAQELAVIYETQEKEKQLYRQQWKMRFQQGAAVAVILTLLLIAVGIYALMRRRTTRLLRRKNEELAHKNKELARLYQTKQNFLNNISHEMRTPLNAIVGFSQVLLTPGLELTDEEYDDMEKRIRESSKLLTDIVDKMIELSYYDTMSEVERIDTVELKTLCKEVMYGYLSSVKPDVKLRVTDDGRAVYTVVTNRDILQRVLRHLMDNAVKFTEKGEIVMGIYLLKTGGITISVTDTGCGIPESRRKEVFELFSETGEQVRTTGMGLNICRTMMRLLQGTISLDENYKLGTRMLINIPYSNIGNSIVKVI